MLKLLMIVIWVTLTSTFFVHETKAVFGVKVSFQATGQMTTFMVYLDNGVTQFSRKLLTERDFIYIASGKWPSIYNPTRENYFEKNQLSCGVMKDSFTLKEYQYCAPFDSLWKLRFEKHPFNMTLGSGWSHGQFNPTLKQELYLYKTYGIGHIDSQFFIGDKFWQLLKDVTDPQWIANYKAIE